MDVPIDDLLNFLETQGEFVYREGLAKEGYVAIAFENPIRPDSELAKKYDVAYTKYMNSLS